MTINIGPNNLLYLIQVDLKFYKQNRLKAFHWFHRAHQKEVLQVVGSAEAGWPWQQGQGTSAKKLTLSNYQVLNKAV